MVAEDAQFSMREPLLGMVPDLTGTKPLVELVGYSRALEICVTGRLLPAAEAMWQFLVSEGARFLPGVEATGRSGSAASQAE